MKEYKEYLIYLQKPAVLVGIGLTVIIIIGAGFFIYSNFKSNKSQGNQIDQKAAQEEVKKLVSEVGKFIDLPTGENPTVATITDITKLKDQPFFARAKNGDKVLIYTNARKAILYDPQAKKVIDIAPINIGSQSAQAASPTPTAKLNPTATPEPSAAQ